MQVVSLVRVSLECLATHTFSYVSTPGRLAAEERWQWRSSPVPFLTAYAGGNHFRCPCTPVQSQSSELPSAKTQGRTVTEHFVFNYFLSVLFFLKSAVLAVDRDEKVAVPGDTHA